MGYDDTILAQTPDYKYYFLDVNGKVILSTKQLDAIVAKAGGSTDDEYSVSNFYAGYAVIECLPVKEGEDMHMSIFIDKKGNVAFSAPGSGKVVIC